MEKMNESKLQQLLKELDEICEMDVENIDELLNEHLIPYYADDYKGQPDLYSEGVRGADYVLLKDGTRIKYNRSQRFWEIDWRKVN